MTIKMRSSKRALHWVWLMLVPMVLATLLTICCGPYLLREQIVQRLTKHHVHVIYGRGKSWMPRDLLKPIQNIPGFHAYGFHLHRADISYYQGTQSEMLPEIVRDLRRLSIPVTADLSLSTDLEGDLRQLSDLQVTSVAISDRNLTREVLGRLGHFSVLHSLVLAGCQFDNDDLAELVQLKQLKFLALDGTTLSDAGSERLAALKSLQSVTLSNTEVSEEAKQKLVDRRPGLNLSDD